VLVAMMTPELQTVIVPHTEEQHFIALQHELERRVDNVWRMRFVGARTIWDAVAIAFHRDLEAERERRLREQQKHGTKRKGMLVEGTKGNERNDRGKPYLR
jgi:hypothetical protein